MIHTLSFLLGFIFAQNTTHNFLSNVEDKRLDKKIIAIEKRLEYGFTKNKSFIDAALINYYLKLGRKDQRYAKLFKLISKQNDSEINQETVAVLANNCLKHECLKHLDLIKKSSAPDVYNTFFGRLIFALDFKNEAKINPYMKNIRSHIFKLDQKADIDRARILNLFITFGDYKNAQKYLTKFDKKQLHPITYLYYKCFITFFLEDLKQADSCFAKIKDPTARNFQSYIAYLQSESTEAMQVSRQYQALLKTDNKKGQMFALTLKLLMDSKLSESEKKQAKDFSMTFDEILPTFSLTYLLNKKNILPKPQTNQILKSFNERFPDHFLTFVLMNKKSNKIIKMKLGERNLAYQVTLDK